MSDQRHRMRWESAGMLAGIVVFLAGVVLLILVFMWTFSLFQAVKHVSSVSLERMGLEVGLLFVMGYVASLIATKGLQLYGVCRGVSPR